MRSALHFGSGMLGSYAGIFSEMWTRNIKGQIQMPEIPRMLKLAEMRRVDGALPVGPALAFLAENEEESYCHCHWKIWYCNWAAVHTINMCQMFLNTDQVSHRREVYT